MQGPTAAYATNDRIEALDGIRGVAILLVMLHHYAQTLTPVSLIDRLVLGTTRVGWVGVDLFFVLSGFLITGILYDTRHARNYFQSFYARRVLRIFPVYYAALAGFFVVLPLVGSDAIGGTAANWPWFWAYASNYLTITIGFPSRYVQHFWSLAIEEQFYLVWPFMVVLLYRRRSLILLSAAVIVAAAALRGALYRHGLGNIANYHNTLTRADALAMGAIVALLVRDPIDAGRLRRSAVWIAIVAAPLGVLVVTQGGGRPAWMRWGLPQEILGYSIVAATFAATLALCVTGSPRSFLNRLFGTSPLRFMGRYSYGIYVIHLPLDTAARNLHVHVATLAQYLGGITPALFVYAILAGGTTVILALLSWHVLERRFLLLKRHFEPEDAATPTLLVAST